MEEININRSFAVKMKLHPGQGSISSWALKPRPVWTLLQNYIHSVLLCYEKQIVPTQEAYEEACTWSDAELSKGAFEEAYMEKPFRLLFWYCVSSKTEEKVQFVGCYGLFSIEQIMKMIRNIIVRYQLYDEFDPDIFEHYEKVLPKKIEEEKAEEQRYRNRSLPVLTNEEPKWLGQEGISWDHYSAFEWRKVKQEAFKREKIKAELRENEYFLMLLV